MPSKNNILSLNDELKFLIACCQTNLSEDDINFMLSYLSAERLTPNALISLANQHGVLPLVYKTLKKIVEDDPSFSSRSTYHVARSTLEHLLADLKSAYSQIARRNMLMSAELIQIIKLFEENGIEALAFKGPALAQRSYGDITLRQFGDLDILIQGSDVSSMIDLLIANDYRPTIDLGREMKDRLIHTLNVIGFYKSAANILIEVHWELLSKNYAVTWDANALWAQTETVTINNTKIPVLPSEEQLLYLCVHGSKHLFERMEWICDIDRSIRANPHLDWDYLLGEAEKRGIKRMLFLGLALCQAFFGLELPAMVQNEMEKDKALPKLISKVIEINFSENPQKAKSFGTFGLLLNMRENLSDKLRFTWQAFFAVQYNDYTFIKLPKYLAFLYPVLRPFRLLTKYFRQ